MSVDEIDAMLNRRSGVLGLGGETDFRQLRKEIELGYPSAELAYGVYIHWLCKYIGAYLAVLGHTDVVTFTAGVGENDAGKGRDALTGLASLGIVLVQMVRHSHADDRAEPRVIEWQRSRIPFDHLDVAARRRLSPRVTCANSRSISTTVTRGAVRASARVVGPGPGPSSSRLSVAEGDGGQSVGRGLSRISFPTSCWRTSADGIDSFGDPPTLASGTL